MAREIENCRQHEIAKAEARGERPSPAFDSLIGFQPHWLRATFVTHAREMKVDHRVLQKYIGHTGSDVMAQFYEIIGPERFKAEVISAVERICDKYVNVQNVEYCQ